MPKNILAISDISTIGRGGLNVTLPILSREVPKIQVSPLLSCVHSSICSVYGNPHVTKLTQQMQKTFLHIKALNIKYDYIYSGFLSSAFQGDIIGENLGNSIYICDPAFADNGKIYSSLNPKIKKMFQKLIKHADFITPNFTEANFLTDNKYKTAEDMALALGENTKNVIITSSPNENYENIDIIINKKGEITRILGDYEPKNIDGAGDAFCAYFMSRIIMGEELARASSFAADKVKNVFCGEDK